MAVKLLNMLNRLMRKRLLIWGLVLLLILFFLGILGAIFWKVRMKVSYSVEMLVEEIPPRWRILVTIPRQPFQLIREGDRSKLVPGRMGAIDGEVEKIVRENDSLRLTVLVSPGQKGKGYRFPENKRVKGEITLRAIRLIAAFSRQPIKTSPAAS
jgi:hypothetical protein